MPTGKKPTSWKVFHKYAVGHRKFLTDLLKNPHDPNKVLAKYKKGPLTGNARLKWNKQWSKAVRSNLAPHMFAEGVPVLKSLLPPDAGIAQLPKPWPWQP